MGADLSTVNSREVEELVGFLKSGKESSNLKLVSGVDILKAYHCGNYDTKFHKVGGGLNDSCMRHATKQEYLKIYTKNPNVVSCLVMYNSDGEVQGRAFRTFFLMFGHLLGLIKVPLWRVLAVAMVGKDQ